MLRVSCFYGGTIGPRTITGGDRHGLEIWSAWSQREDCDLEVFTSYWGSELIKAFGYQLNTRATEEKPSEIGVSRLGYARRFTNALRTALSAPHADVVYAASPYFYDLLPALALKLRTRRSRLIVALFHLIPPPSKRTGSPVVNTIAWIEQRIMVFVARYFADHVIVDNAHLVEDLARLGVSRQRIVLSPMGVRHIPPRNGTAGACTFDAIYVGRLANPKGVPGLIRAWADVVRRIPSAKLALVGNNEVGFDAQRLVREAGLVGSVDIFSGLSDDQVQNALQQSKVFVTGSLEEGYGLSVLEALATGLPCVTFDIPAFQYAFPVGRYAARGYDEAALAQALIDVLIDDALRETLSRRIAEEVEIKTWPKIAQELWAICVH